LKYVKTKKIQKEGSKIGRKKRAWYAGCRMHLMVRESLDYEYSSYASYVSGKIDHLNKEKVLGYFNGNQEEEYRMFVEEIEGFGIEIEAVTIKGMQQTDQISAKDLSVVGLIGELSLNGRLRSCNGILPMVSEAKRMGISEVIIPYTNRITESCSCLICKLDTNKIQFSVAKGINMMYNN
jgi:hypothetical protein